MKHLLCSDKMGLHHIIGWLALAAMCCSSPLYAQEGGSSWQNLTQSRLRLLTSGPPVQNLYHAGVELELSGNALTYWRSPGDVGVAPDVRDEGSDNLSAFSLSFPAPHRYEEAGAQAYGYKNHVLFPLLLTPKDSSRPINLRLVFSYAVCETLCIPIQSHLALTFSPDAAQPSLAPLVAEAEALVPKRINDGPEIKVEASSASNKKRWSLHLPASFGEIKDVFVETPEEWFVATLASTPTPVLELAQSPSAPSPEPVPAVVTIETSEGAYEWHTHIDMKP